MSWELEPWSPPAEPNNNELASVDSEPDVIDASWSPVETEPDYDLEQSPEPDNRRGSWGGGAWMQQSEPDTAPVTYAEPDVIDTPFTWLQPEPDNAPVKRDSWGGGWFGSNSQELDAIETDSSEIERYTAAYLESEDETLEASWQPLQQPTQAALPADTDAIPAPDWWAQTTALTSQATDVWQDVATDNSTQTKSRNSSKTRAKTRNKARQSTAIETYSPPTTPTGNSSRTAYEQPTNSPSSMQSGGGAPNYAWYFVANDDPAESEDIHALRHWYFLYEYGDGFEEWDEVKFHEWHASLHGSDYELYVNAGREIMNNELVTHLKEDSQLKTAYRSMRLEGDAPSAPRSEPIGRIAAAILRGFSR